MSITYAYQPNSNQIATVTAGNVKTTYSMESSDGALLSGISVQNTGTSSNLFNESIGSYNEIDQRTSESVSRVNVSNTGTMTSQTQDLGYTYDASHADALTTVKNTDTNAVLDSYSYDGVGNRTGTALGSVVSARYYNIDNQYSNVSYNGDGDVTNDGTFTYSWDTNDHLIGATPDSPVNGSEQEQMGYDSQNRMIWQTIQTYNATTSAWVTTDAEHFLYDGSNMTAILDGNNQLLEEFTYGPTGRIAETDFPADPNNPDPSAGPTTYIIVSDASQNETELVNETTGAVSASVHYAGPFGENMTVTGPAAFINQFGFAGGWTDQISGLVYFQNRWYSPTQDRFMSEDPSGISGGIDLYTYSENDPINKNDSTGLSPTDDYPPLIQFTPEELAANQISPLPGPSTYSSIGAVPQSGIIQDPDASPAVEFVGSFLGSVGNGVQSAAKVAQEINDNPLQARQDAINALASHYTAKILATAQAEPNFKEAENSATSPAALLLDFSGISSINEAEQGYNIYGNLSTQQRWQKGLGGSGQLLTLAAGAIDFAGLDVPLTGSSTAVEGGVAASNVPVPMGGCAVGGISGRPFDPDLAGGPIENLTTDGVQITNEGIDGVEQHLARFGTDEANQAMVTRLRSVADGSLESTEYDVNFYTHELREAERYGNLGWPTGQPADPEAAYELWNNAHTATLEDYGLKDGQLYHPDTLP